MNSGSSMISGCSTVNFDLIIKEKIYEAIDCAKLSAVKDLKKDYGLMKYRLGRPPMMVDFLEQGGREPYAFVNYSKSSYYEFVKKIDTKGHPDMDKESERLLAFYSKEILNAKRIEEILLLGLLKGKRSVEITEFNEIMKKRLGFLPDEKTVISAINNLNGNFLKDKDRAKYGRLQSIEFESSERSPASRVTMDSDFWEKISAEPLTVYLDDEE